MGVEFPNKWSYFWSGAEDSFKNYVSAACRERGYSNDQSWGINYTAMKHTTGDLNFHMGKIFEKLKGNLRGYERTKRWAQTAANTICPGTNTGGSAQGQGLKLPFFAFLIFQGLQLFMGQSTINREQNYYGEEITSIESSIEPLENEITDPALEDGYTNETDFFGPYAAMFSETPAPIAYP
jgi:hypothetical protein